MGEYFVGNLLALLQWSAAAWRHTLEWVWSVIPEYGNEISLKFYSVKTLSHRTLPWFSIMRSQEVSTNIYGLKVTNY